MTVQLLGNYSSNIVFVPHFWSWRNKKIIEMERLISASCVTIKSLNKKTKWGRSKIGKNMQKKVYHEESESYRSHVNEIQFTFKSKVNEKCTLSIDPISNLHNLMKFFVFVSGK